MLSGFAHIQERPSKQVKGNLIISGRNASQGQSRILGSCRNEAGAKIVQEGRHFTEEVSMETGVILV